MATNLLYALVTGASALYLKCDDSKTNKSLCREFKERLRMTVGEIERQCAVNPQLNARFCEPNGLFSQLLKVISDSDQFFDSVAKKGKFKAVWDSDNDAYELDLFQQRLSQSVQGVQLALQFDNAAWQSAQSTDRDTAATMQALLKNQQSMKKKIEASAAQTTEMSEMMRDMRDLQIEQAMRERKKAKESGEAIKHREVTATMDWGVSESWHSRPGTPETTEGDGDDDGGGAPGGSLGAAISPSWSDTSDPGADDDTAERRKQKQREKTRRSSPPSRHDNGQYGGPGGPGGYGGGHGGHNGHHNGGSAARPSSYHHPGTFELDRKITLQFAGEHLDAKDKGFLGTGKSDPYIILSLPNRTGLIKQTETIFKTLDPEWAPFFLTVAEFCGGDGDARIHVDAYDEDKLTAHDFIGATTISLNELVAGNVTEWELINPKKRVGRKAKKYINSGVLRLKNFVLEHRESVIPPAPPPGMPLQPPPTYGAAPGAAPALAPGVWWVLLDPPGGWTGCDAGTAALLEHAFTAGQPTTHLTRGQHEYEVLFDRATGRHVQSNNKFGTARDLKRTSDGLPPPAPPTLPVRTSLV